VILFREGNKYILHRYQGEDDFEIDVFSNSKHFFGLKSILVDVKKRIDSKSLGGAIPDAFLFEISDPKNPEFYLVEIELSTHDFYKHIFPQITKFFSFFRNTESRKDLVEKIYSVITTDSGILKLFKKLIGNREVYKFISDTIENSQNILLVIDGEKKELPEIVDTYTDTWGKTVKVLIIQKYYCDSDILFLMNPEFERIEYALINSAEEVTIQSGDITEEFHFEGISESVREIYHTLKKSLYDINNELVFNPQKYYISIVNKKNVIFCKFRKSKIRLVVMLPYETIKQNISSHEVKELSQPVQDFYNGPCAAVDITDLKNIDEIINLLKPLVIKS